MRKNKLTSDGDTAEAQTRLDLEYVVDDSIGTEADRVGDETILVAFDGADHSRLRLGRLVVVDYTDASEELSIRLSTR